MSYKLDLSKERILGYVDNMTAIKQAVYKILSTQRYYYEIYDRNYGIYTADLFGKNIDFVKNEISRRIKDALLCDDRIYDVYNFIFDNSEKSVLSVKFTVKSSSGVFDAEKEVNY